MAQSGEVASGLRNWLRGIIGTIVAGLILAYVASQNAKENARIMQLTTLERDVTTLQQRQQILLDQHNKLHAEYAVQGEALHQLDTRMTRLEAQETVRDQRMGIVVERMLKVLETHLQCPERR